MRLIPPILDYYRKIKPIPKDDLRGFGYSFSNIGENLGGNDRPYFAVGAVNSRNLAQEAVLLYKTSPFCINLKPSCKSTLTATPATIYTTTRGLCIITKY